MLAVDNNPKRTQKCEWEKLYELLLTDGLDPELVSHFKAMVMKEVNNKKVEKEFYRAQNCASLDSIWTLAQHLQFGDLSHDQNRIIGMWAIRGFSL